MYSGLSNIYKERMKLPAQVRRLTGTLNGQPITGKNIIANSAKILRQCSEKNDIQIGQVYIGQLDITLTNVSIPWRQLKDKEIVLYEGLWIDRSEEREESYWEDVELGHFFISDAPSSVMGFECTCYDAMSKFDTKMGTHNPTGTSKTLYQLIDLACTQCGVTLGMTQSQINDMPNGNETLVVYGEDNDMETYQDLLSWCAQTMGANALINRSGQLVFKKYDSINSVVETFTAKDRIGNSGKCSSFETFYTGISMVNIEESTTSYYGLNPDNGSVMNLGSNPLLQPYEGQTEQQLETKRRRILTAISDINYTPFDNIRLNRPCVYDLMDVVELTGGILGDSVDIYGCITKYEWTLLGGMKIQGAGANPALASAKSKTDKNIVGLQKSEEKTKKDVKDAVDDVSNLSTTVGNLSETVEQQTVDIRGKQNFIHVDLLPPDAGVGDEGDLQFYGNSPARLYRRENGAWVKKEWIAYGQTMPVVTPVEGDIFFENDSANITSIKQYIGGVWIPYTTGYGHLVDYLTSEQNTEVKYLDGANIFQRSFYLNDGVSLVPDTWTNVIQSNVIGEVIRAEAKNGNGDMIGVIGRVNNGYVQFMSLMNVNQTLKVLTLQYVKASGSYEFNENYQQGNTYTFAPTINTEEFFVWLVRHFIDVCKSKGGDWTTNPIYSYILSNLSTYLDRFMEYKGNDKGIGMTVTCNLADYNRTTFGISVVFTNGNKSARVAESYSDHGDDSKYLWGNEGQSSLFAKNGVYYVFTSRNNSTGEITTSWHTPEWAYTMYVRYLGIKYSTDNSTYLGIENVSNYGIHFI